MIIRIIFIYQLVITTCRIFYSTPVFYEIGGISQLSSNFTRFHPERVTLQSWIHTYFLH